MKIIYGVIILLTLSLISSLFVGCGDEVTSSLWDPEKVTAPNPVITQITPPDSALAGITILTIAGQNFSSNVDENFVYFDAHKVDVITASETELTLKTPNIIGDSIQIKIAVHGAENFSNIVYYILEYTAYEYGGIDHFSDAYGLAYDNEDNVYVSLGSYDILQITPEEEQITYVTGAPGFFKMMKMGPGGTLYAGRTKFIYQVPPGGGSIGQFGTKLSKSVNDFDFDPDGNIFVACKDAIYCVKPDGTNSLSLDCPSYNLKSLRVYNGYVYVAGEYSGTDANETKKGVWRNKITSSTGDLDVLELAFNWSDFAGEFGANILSLTFDIDGGMYIGADAEAAITIIFPNADGNYVNGETKTLYPEVLKPESTALCWDNGNYLFVNRKGPLDEDKRLIRVTMPKKGAPYYGRK